MPHNNEQVIDQWVEENGKTRFTEFDGTERKDGGNEVPDLDWDRTAIGTLPTKTMQTAKTKIGTR
jgi:hypothetical protein